MITKDLTTIAKRIAEIEKSDLDFNLKEEKIMDIVMENKLNLFDMLAIDELILSEE